MSSEDFNPTDFELAPLNINFQSHEEKVAENFGRLYTLNVNDKTQEKNGLRYLSWSSAWAEFKKVHPLATFSIIKDPTTNLPYTADPIMGIFVSTSVTADGITYEMTLPVLDSANRPLKMTAYTIQVWDKFKKAYVEKTVDACTSFDINRGILRCLTKCMALHGLGLYVYQGEDFPEEQDTVPTDEAPQPRKRSRNSDPLAGIKTAIQNTTSTNQLYQLYQEHEAEIKGHPEILSLLTQRKEELLNAA